LAASVFGGCSVHTGLTPPSTPTPPEQYHNARSVGEFVDDRWWESFGDPTLDGLMTELFDRNLSIQAALARLDQFAAVLRFEDSSLMPQIDAGTEGSRNVSKSSQGTVALNSWSAGATISYEVDLWGKLKAGRQASYADFLASEQNARALVLSISAQLANQYFRIVELRQQQDLLRKTIDFYEENLAFVERRYLRGTVTSLDLYQAETSLADVRAQLSGTDEELALTEHVLSLLLGRYPRTEWLSGETELPEPPAPLAAGLPGDLIALRPDIRAAHHQMEAADRRTAQAIANRLPGIRLTASLAGYGTSEPSSPTTMIGNALIGVAQPLFYGGALEAEEERARAVWREAATNYTQAVLQAFREVEDALVQKRHQEEKLHHLEDLEEASRESLRLATDQYLMGTSDYLQVIVSQAAHLSASRRLISAHGALIRSHTQLAVALGGSWTDEALRRARSSTANVTQRN
jgi:NodT family efflux transporter outer membrane factor (OMF) lipoprotein